jgi:hypothetical protein
MSKNIIYTCYDCPDGNVPGFVNLHINLARQYANRIGCDFKAITNVTTTYRPIVFVVYEAYKHFAESNYDKMLWIDWDVLITLNSPDIFKEYEDNPFVAYRWRDSYTDSKVVINSIDDYLDHVNSPEPYDDMSGPPGVESSLFLDFLTYVCEDDITSNMLELYINQECSGGVMLIDRPTMSKFLYGKYKWNELYDKLQLLYELNHENHAGLLNAGAILSKYVIDYLRIKNNIPFYYLDKKWNSSSVINKMSLNDHFLNFNGACTVNGTNKEKDAAILSFVMSNKQLFFSYEDEFNSYIKNYSGRELTTALKSKNDAIT